MAANPNYTKALSCTGTLNAAGTTVTYTDDENVSHTINVSSLFTPFGSEEVQISIFVKTTPTFS